jgi:hypothetical protein
MKALVTFVTFLGGIVLVACGGAPPPPPEAPPAPAPAPVATVAPIQATQELGSIDEDATNRTFSSLQNQLLDCQKKGMGRVEFLAGDARFFVRIAQDGTVRWAYLEDSTVGDRATEKCLLGVVSGAHWPKPDGGEAEVQKSVSFDVGDARPPVQWSSDKVSSVIARDGGDALQCKKGVKGAFKVTAYVSPGDAASAPSRKKGRKGKHDEHTGKVLSVGVAPPSKDGEAKVDCIVDAVMDWKMPSPGGYAAKVTFTL